MKKIASVFFLCVCSLISLRGQDTRTKNLIIITLDGLRWQEIFHGADSAILCNKEYSKDKNTISQFWHTSSVERREMLMPFFWNVIGTQGQLYGNRDYKSDVNCANPHWFSYPGYSEILTGFVDRRVKSNDRVENPNYTVLEFIHQQRAFQNKVAAFGTWDVFPYIFREEKSGIPVNAGGETATDTLSQRESLLNELQQLIKNPYGSRYDAFTFYYAFEYLKRKQPRVLFIGFDETDEHAHKGHYDEYLKSANRSDEMISRLWTWVQSHPKYKDQTTMIITTDHGRGKGHRNSWKNHGRLAFGSGQAWFAILGPDTPANGEMKTPNRYYLKQLAKTSASFLEIDYTNIEPVGDAVKSAISTELIRSNILDQKQKE